jgi:hypothetical protein
MKSYSFWNVRQCSSVDIHRRFGGTHCLHLQYRSNQPEESSKLVLMLPAFSVYFSTMKNEAVIFHPETSIHFYQTKRRYIPVDSALHLVKFPINFYCKNMETISRY